MFLRNYWYVAAYDHEIGRRPLGRIILGEPIVFYRLEDGTPVALEDRCAHRHLPLSMGTLVGDTLQCHYHGLRYDKTGTCVWTAPFGMDRRDAFQLAICRARSSSNLIGLLYPSAEWRRLAL
jgi:phenylpropionate dioxygenase-like ring-hydroxylating dioxygenase large terminal subunit